MTHLDAGHKELGELFKLPQFHILSQLLYIQLEIASRETGLLGSQRHQDLLG